VTDLQVKFAGGEPTLAMPQLEEFYNKMTSRFCGSGINVHWTVLTNGTNSSRRFLEFVDRSNAAISISLDGFGADHDLYRVRRSDHAKGSWKQVYANINAFLEHGKTPYINAMVGPHTMHGLPKFASWIFDNRMPSTIHVVRNLEDSWQNGSHRRQGYADYCTKLAAAFELMFAELENKVSGGAEPVQMDIAELYFDQPAPSICCGIGTDHIVVKHDGTIASCPMTVHERTVEVQNHDVFAAASDSFAASPDERADDGCLSCQWYRVCASGCPVANQRIMGHAFTRSPLCQFWKYVIPRYVDYVGHGLVAKRTH
jgi:uncharacterized protein